MRERRRFREIACHHCEVDGNSCEVECHNQSLISSGLSGIADWGVRCGRTSRNESNKRLKDYKRTTTRIYTVLDEGQGYELLN